MSGWGCPHEVAGVCTHVNNVACDPGMKGCVLYGRYRFANEDKNERLRVKQARAADASGSDSGPAAPRDDDAS
jgi:orotidine-5'-phosphate decarboxylase